ncbi:chloride channel protein [Streptomyces longwoodensis]|uniref:chloride channel protein n=1 Tax=Streptomyces longwoodensis TaxID=68231 RepID=UPI0030DE9E0C
MSAVGAGPPTAQPRDPLAVVRGRGYPVLLLLAAVLGAPVAAVAFGFLALTDKLQSWTYTDLPRALGFHGTPSWWPLPLLALAGLLTALIIRHLPGTAGHRPTEGLSAKGAPAVRDLPGVVLAALASLGLGAVLGPEAPLIALGAGLGAAAVRLVVRDAPPNVAASMGAAGSFAAISTLLGSPLLGAFLLMEASGLGGALLDVVLVPGLLASGIGALMFTGLGSWTGLGTYSLTLNDVPHAHAPTAAEFGWALVTGVAAACLGTGIKRLGVLLEARVAPRAVRGSVLAGLAVGGLALAYAEGSGRAASEVLYSGQNALGPLLDGSARYSVGTLLLLLVCKALAYGVSMSCFRGGMVFPSMFVGAVGGIALSHCPGMSLAPAFAMGIGGMCVAILRLPLTSVLLATLLMGSDGLTVMPLVITAVAVAYVTSLRLEPAAGEPPAAGAVSGGS